jgi:hypothetical protein
MSDPEQPPDTTAQPNVTIEQAGSPPPEGKPAGAFSQEDVNRIVAARLTEDRARRPAQAPASKPASVNGTKPSDPDLQAQIAELQKSQTDLLQRLDYTSRVAKLGMPESPALFKVFQADPEGFEGTVSMLGLKPQQPATPNGTTVDPAKSGAAAPSAPSGPVNGNNHGGVPDLWSLSVAQIDAMGPAGVRAEYEKIMAVGNARAGAPPRPRVAQRK